MEGLKIIIDEVLEARLLANPFINKDTLELFALNEALDMVSKEDKSLAVRVEFFTDFDIAFSKSYTDLYLKRQAIRDIKRIKFFKAKSSAQRVARKKFGNGYAKIGSIVKLNGTYSFILTVRLVERATQEMLKRVGAMVI